MVPHPCWHYTFLIAGQLTELLMSVGHSVGHNGTSADFYIKNLTPVAGSDLNMAVTHLRN